jgi:hypothetical protein
VPALPPVTTSGRASFEVWTLGGEVGDEHTLSTRVMLVADKLVRMSRRLNDEIATRRR